MTSRYDQFRDIIAAHKPTTIVEIGVHEGRRAVFMVREALRHVARVDYFGFDVFETLGPEFQEAALNGKGMAYEHVARDALTREERTHGASRFGWTLTVGDTRTTLAARNVVADLVFIDGDHRLDAIRSDYEAVKGSRVVVFDDYYQPDARGAMPDVALYGANRVVDLIEGATILPVGDPTKHGGRAHLAVVVRR
ncbi:MAG: class I SAM-dependent methyltransferase [Gemmatimonadota bacterium]